MQLVRKGARTKLRLQEERERLGLSKSEVARRTGSMHPSSIYQIEKGYRSPGYKQRDLLTKVMIAAGWDGDGDLFEDIERGEDDASM